MLMVTAASLCCGTNVTPALERGQENTLLTQNFTVMTQKDQLLKSNIRNLENVYYQRRVYII